ncbi:MAG TPA: hypothetical protein VM487_17960 [Phycisphaerae bacterium]|nr:hypothetical protein [Phycisphaerae bacterium]
MTENEFHERRSELSCKRCGSSGLVLRQAPPPHEGMISCADCDAWFDWVKKPENADKRPKLKAGTIARVWSAWGGVCACCNMSTASLERLGIERTVQHVPAFKQAGDSARLIPFCGWCQARGAAEMKRMETLLKRIDGDSNGEGF